MSSIKDDVILVTGGAGFIGLNFIDFFFKKKEKKTLINLDKLTSISYISDLKFLSHKNYKFIKGDIRDKSLLNKLISKYNIDCVVNFAAESHVDNSIAHPDVFIDTNIVGTHNLLSVFKEEWLDDEFYLKKAYKNAKFIHISTDEVYGTLGKTGFFTEESKYMPNNPYSASKASSDLLVRSYVETYNFPAVITNCSNNFGPYQHNEKLIPTIIRKALSKEQIPIYGSGENIRDWVYVEDHVDAIFKIIDKGQIGETYLIGGNQEKTNIEIANYICNFLNKCFPKEKKLYSELIKFVEDRKGHDYRYAINAEKIKKYLGWKVRIPFEQAINRTIEWYIKKYGYK